MPVRAILFGLEKWPCISLDESGRTSVNDCRLMRLTPVEKGLGMRSEPTANQERSWVEVTLFSLCLIC